MPENIIKIILEAENKTNAAFKELQSTSQSVLSSLKSHWLEFTAAGASIYGMIKGVQSFVDEAAKAEVVESRLAFQIGAVGIKYKEVKIAIDAFANSIQNTTRFSDEAARSGLTQMMQYTVSLKDAMDGLKLAMDMATQVAGGDLTLAIKYVGMAMNGDIEVLSKMNPAFKHLGDTLGENATQAEKAEYGLKKLKELFGGAGEKDLTTYAGKVDQLTKSWIEFKKTLGGEVLPALNEILDVLTKIGKVGIAGAVGGTEKDRLEAEIASWNDILKNLPEGTGKMQLDIMARIEGAKKRIIEITDKQVDAEKKVEESMATVADASQKAVGTKQWNEFIGALHLLNQSTEETKIYVTELQATFNELNITSSIDLVGMATAAQTNMELIKKAVSEGKASWKDYQNALVSATEAMKKLVAPDITKSMADLQKRYEEGAKTISKDDPEFRKKIEALADSINEEMKKIQGPSTAELEAQFREYNAKFQQEMGKLQSELAGAGAEKIKIKIDTTEIEGSFNEVYKYFKNLKEKIESNPIIVNSSGGSAGGGNTPLMPGMSGYAEKIVQDYVMEFTGEGMSPAIPLGEAFDELGNKITGAKAQLQNMDLAIDFSNASTAINNLGGEIKKLTAVYWNWQSIISSPYVSADTKLYGIDPNEREKLFSQMRDTMDQVFNTELEQLKNYMALTGQELTKAIWDRFVNPFAETKFPTDIRWTPPFTYEEMAKGSFQTGGYVGATGLYMLHKGEEVQTTNQVSMSTGDNIFNIYGSDPKKVADEIAKILKYEASGNLKKAIKNIR